MERINSLTKINAVPLIKFLGLLTIATFAPLLGLHSQWVTGPIVNMALILALFTIGIRSALLIALLPSTIALSVGLLPSVLAPMIPFIIISNVLLILVMDYFRNKNYGWGLFFGAGLKYLFLFITSNLVINLLLNHNLAAQVAVIMSWPQFFTALIGGLLAWGLLKFRFIK